MGVLYQTCHSIYDHVLPKRWCGQSVRADIGMSIRESQPFLIEMHVYRSKKLLKFAVPLTRNTFNKNGPE